MKVGSMMFDLATFILKTANTMSQPKQDEARYSIFGSTAKANCRLSPLEAGRLIEIDCFESS